MQVPLPIWANFAESYASLAAAAVVVAATAIAAAIATHQAVPVAAAAEQQNQNDNPPAVIIAHKIYLRNFFKQFPCSFQDIPWQRKCAN